MSQQYNLLDRLGQLAADPFTHGPVLLGLAVFLGVVAVASFVTVVVVLRRDRDYPAGGES